MALTLGMNDTDLGKIAAEPGNLGNLPHTVQGHLYHVGDVECRKQVVGHADLDRPRPLQRFIPLEQVFQPHRNLVLTE